MEEQGHDEGTVESKLVEDPKLAELIAHTTKDEEQSVVDHKKEALEYAMGRPITTMEPITDEAISRKVGAEYMSRTAEFTDKITNAHIELAEENRKQADAKADRVEEVYNRIKDI